MICIILGKTCTGKSFLSNLIREQLANKNDIEFIECSSVFKKLKLTNKTLKQDITAVARNLLAKNINYNDNSVVITGCRLKEEIEYLKDKCNNTVCIIIKSNCLNRYNRYKFRIQKGYVSSFRKYIKKIFGDMFLGINCMLSYVEKNMNHLVIYNNDNLSDYSEIINNYVVPIIKNLD